MVNFAARVVATSSVTGTLGYAGATVAAEPGGDPSGPRRTPCLPAGHRLVPRQRADRLGARPLVNTPVTSGDAIWTEPNATSEISIAGTRVRMDGASQLDMLALDDTQTRMQLDQGRIDIKTFTCDARQPYEIVTPRGIITLQQQGDYYVEAGTTRIRRGSACARARPRSPAERPGAGGARRRSRRDLRRRGHATTPHDPDRAAADADLLGRARPQIGYDQPPQYLSADVVGYEDLQAYGTWSNDPEYGQVWSPRNGASRLAALQHRQLDLRAALWLDLGRRAAVGLRALSLRPLGQSQQSLVLGAAGTPAARGLCAGAGRLHRRHRAQHRDRRAIPQPVGWFPLGPREVYVPPYTNDRNYYNRINENARVERRSWTIAGTAPNGTRRSRPTSRTSRWRTAASRRWCRHRPSSARSTRSAPRSRCRRTRSPTPPWRRSPHRLRRRSRCPR